MHKAIFSEKEREIIKEYLETRAQSEGFRVLKHRVTQYMLPIMEDYELMIKFVEKGIKILAKTEPPKEK